ncbi:MAG TPA: PA2169 family four-helix-bundle protein [Terriglobales bacterium]|nr:PA2169 family four-helix-bundle protein [Terriglobales bacterium]
MDVNNAVSVLEELIQTCKDGQKGYLEAASKIKRPDLKTFFTEQAAERGRFATELEAELGRIGNGDKKLSGSVLGTLHRAWIDTKVSLGGGDKTVLEWLEHGEDRAKDAYQKAVRGSLPASLMEIIRRQAASVQAAHDKVKQLRDTAETMAA